VRGNEVTWQKWNFRVGFTAREGLVLHQVGYEDQGRLRPLVYRASLAEMVVPYGDPGKRHYTKNAFDVGEYGVGYMANSLELGCDCLGEVHYFDAVVATSTGEAVRIDNAVCLHEEDFGVLWRHRDWRTGDTEVRRSRRLVLSFLRHRRQLRLRFLLVLLPGRAPSVRSKADRHPQYRGGAAGGEAAIRNARRPTALCADPPACLQRAARHGGRWAEQLSLRGRHQTGAARTGQSARQCLRGRSKRCSRRRRARVAGSILLPVATWLVANAGSVNGRGEPVAYKLKPGENGVLFADPGSSVAQRAGFASHHLWVTPFDPDEKFPAGDYPNQHAGGDGLSAWTEKNRPVTDTDIVVWYTFAHLHLPRPEDWPVMPVGYVGFMLEPVGFFERNPAIDVPPPHPKACH